MLPAEAFTAVRAFTQSFIDEEFLLVVIESPGS